MHLGEEDSVLTNLVNDTSEVDPLNPSPVLSQLVICIEQLLKENQSKEKPVLILNGDILDLALSNVSNALMGFQCFMNLIMKEKGELFSRIIYIPGNHDHHLWEIARETQYVEYVAGKSVEESLPEPWHTTNMFDRTVPCYMLNKLIQRQKNMKKFNIEVAYPNFALCSASGKRSVVFSHGHFTESAYRFMSLLHKELFDKYAVAQKVWDIEKENFAWIDFIWSTIGRSGVVGEDAENLYEKIGDQKAFETVLREVAANLAQKHDIPYVPGIPLVMKEDEVEAKVILWLLKKVFNKSLFEKHRVEKPESAELKSGIENYLDNSIRQQFDDENRSSAAEDLTFVFGHTHKPYTSLHDSKKFSSKVKLHNSGGWVVDTAAMEKVHGASLVLLDSELNAVSLCMYKESKGAYAVSLEEPLRNNESASTLYKELSQCVVATREPWSRFSDEVAKAIKIRRKNFIERLHISKKTKIKDKLPNSVT